MESWQKTGCVLCAQNCGLLVKIVDNRIVKVKGDNENPRSRGYLCRKGANIANYQHHDDRLTTPLKKTDKSFIEISWAQAVEDAGVHRSNRRRQKGTKKFAKFRMKG